MSFTEIIKRNSSNIFLYKAKQDGRFCWFYIKVKSPKSAIFKRKKKGDVITPSEFGEVIECGFGLEPPKNIKKQIKEKYNFE